MRSAKVKKSPTKMSAGATIRRAGAGDADLLSKIIRRSFRVVANEFGLTSQNCLKHPSNCRADWITSDLKRGVRYFILEAE